MSQRYSTCMRVSRPKMEEQIVEVFKNILLRVFPCISLRLSLSPSPSSTWQHFEFQYLLGYKMQSNASYSLLIPIIIKRNQVSFYQLEDAWQNSSVCSVETHLLRQRRRTWPCCRPSLPFSIVKLSGTWQSTCARPLKMLSSFPVDFASPLGQRRKIWKIDCHSTFPFTCNLCRRRIPSKMVLKMYVLRPAL